jgi:hypothetical protein
MAENAVRQVRKRIGMDRSLRISAVSSVGRDILFSMIGMIADMLPKQRCAGLGMNGVSQGVLKFILFLCYSGLYDQNNTTVEDKPGNCPPAIAQGKIRALAIAGCKSSL